MIKKYLLFLITFSFTLAFKRLIFKDAQGLFEKEPKGKADFTRGRTTIEAWDLSGFEMDGAAKKSFFLDKVKQRYPGKGFQKKIYLFPTGDPKNENGNKYKC